MKITPLSYRKHHIKPKIKNFRKRKLIKRFVFWFSAFVIAAFIGLYVIVSSSTFTVSKIEISGNKNITSGDINGFLSSNVGTIFFVNTAALAQKALSKFPSLESVTIQKKFPDALFVKVKERQTVALFCLSSGKNDQLSGSQAPLEQHCFLIDGNGVIFSKPQGITSDFVVIRQTFNDQNTFLGKRAVEKSIMDAILQIQENLKNNFHIDAVEVVVHDILLVKTSEGWSVYFDPASDIDTQIAKMNLLLKGEISASDRKNLHYIYLQYKDRAYYK